MKKYLKAFAFSRYKDFIIERYEDDSIAIEVRHIDNTLRKIAEEIGYEKYSHAWSIPDYANRLIKYIQRTDNARKKVMFLALMTKIGHGGRVYHQC